MTQMYILMLRRQTFFVEGFTMRLLLISLLVLAPQVFAQTVPLNDTGQTKCFKLVDGVSSLVACTSANTGDRVRLVHGGQSFDALAPSDIIFQDRFELLSGGPAPSAFIRLLHLLPDAPAVDIYVDDSLEVTDVSFLDGTLYIDLPEGTYDVTLAPAGTGIGSSLLSLNGLELTADTFYTVAAYDVVASIQALELVDDQTGIPAGNTRLQVSHTASGLGTVDVWELDSGTKLISDLAFGTTSQLDVPHGALVIGLDLTGDSVPDLIFDVPDLGPDTFVNVFAVAEDLGLLLLAQLNNGTTIPINPRP